MPDQENTPFELPATLPTDVGELQALEAQATAAFTARYDQGASTQEDVTELESLAEPIRAIRAALTTAQEGGEGEGEGEGEGAEEPEAPDAPAPDEPEAPVEPEEAVAPSAASAVLDSMVLRSASAPVEVPAPAPVPARAAAPAAPAPVPTSIAAAAIEAPADHELPVHRDQPITIVASADIPGVPAASSIDGMKGLVAAIGAKARSVPNQGGSRWPVASIQKPLHDDRTLDGLSERDAMERMNDLSSVDYLVASGGWCAPSEQVYDFACEVEAPPDAVVLPTGTTSRGGVKYPISPTFRDFYALENNGLFTWTEADDIAAADNDGSPGDTVKPCFHIPCVTFDETRLELEGLCVTAGNLTDRAYPELIRRYMSLVLTAHLHRMNSQKITKMLALVDDTVVFPDTFGAASALLVALELQVQDLRDQFSMSENAVIEGMLPRWVRGIIRADVARREQSGLDTVSNADVTRYLQDAGMRIQFVSDWQLLGDELNPATAWPNTVQALLWIPGAYRELTGPTLDIAVARDSTLNATNDFTVAFTEESYQVYKPGCGSRLVEIPVCPNGAVGDRVLLDCPANSF